MKTIYIKLPIAAIGIFKVTNKTLFARPSCSISRFEDGSFLASFALSCICFYISTSKHKIGA